MSFCGVGQAERSGVNGEWRKVRVSVDKAHVLWSLTDQLPHKPN